MPLTFHFKSKSERTRTPTQRTSPADTLALYERERDGHTARTERRRKSHTVQQTAIRNFYYIHFDGAIFLYYGRRSDAGAVQLEKLPTDGLRATDRTLVWAYRPEPIMYMPAPLFLILFLRSLDF